MQRAVSLLCAAMFAACGHTDDAVELAHSEVGIYAVSEIPTDGAAIHDYAWAIVDELEAAGDLTVEIDPLGAEYPLRLADKGETLFIRSDVLELPEASIGYGILHELTHYRAAQDHGAGAYFRCIENSDACAGAAEIGPVTTSLHAMIAGGLSDDEIREMRVHGVEHVADVAGDEPWIVSLADEILAERTESALAERGAPRLR